MLDPNQIPYITAEQMIEVDRMMVEDYGIQLIQMMENAGRNLAILARNRFLNGNVTGTKVTVLAGSGGNGGGAMVSARHLHNWGAVVSLFLTRPVKELNDTIKIQAEILKRMSIQSMPADLLDQSTPADLILDGIIGYSLKGAPQGTAATMIQWANRQNVSILALDVPSGLDASTGMVLEPAIRAAATMTLALPKIGLRTTESDLVGELYLADIGVPPQLYNRPPLNLEVGNLFKEELILRLS